ncbi:hypothetical protein [uncultured Alloprevotella sp.]|uniref:hypothetical protein n=1 Tax=uncultured Alloprevotella sp. TaxID=1283315 RepID=UPI00262FA8A1|nr:hypothetical protein [uncultured Alloprevotella sp.]
MRDNDSLLGFAVIENQTKSAADGAKNAISVPAAAMFGARGTLMGTCRSLSGHCASVCGLR